MAVKMISAARFLVLALGLPCLAQAKTLHAGALTVGPYASVSSTKAIKPDNIAGTNSSATTETQTVTQRLTYGVKADLRLGRLFVLSANGGVNKVDTTKKSIAMRDEYGDIDFQKDANVDVSNSDAPYRYKEEQRLANVQLTVAPRLFGGLWIKAGAGVRARQRLITITDDTAGTSQSIKDPIRYSPSAVAGIGINLLGAFSASMEYKFYFPKFPKTEPHEQEVLVTAGVQI